jgi:hypothetical protein
VDSYEKATGKFVSLLSRLFLQMGWSNTTEPFLQTCRQDHLEHKTIRGYFKTLLLLEHG